jgi:F420H(2)-dependent biliverdin reductase
VRAVGFPVDNLPTAALTFLTDRHLASLSIAKPDGKVHVSPVGFTFDAADGLARIITSSTARKSAHAATAGRVSICQIDGAYWLTLEGTVRVSSDAVEVAEAVARYEQRYRPPRVNPERVVLIVAVERIYGRLPAPDPVSEPATESPQTS